MVSVTHIKYYPYQQYSYLPIFYWCHHSLPNTHIYSPHRYTPLMHGVETKWFIYVLPPYLTYWPYISIPYGYTCVYSVTPHWYEGQCYHAVHHHESYLYLGWI